MTRNDGSFFCKGCLVDHPPLDTSPDPRYCQSCYDYLCQQYESRTPSEATPVGGQGLFFSLGLETGDRVQTVVQDEMIEAHWLTVTGTSQKHGITTHVFIRVSPDDPESIPIAVTVTNIVAHLKGEDNVMAKNTDPKENLMKCRLTLAKVTGEGADPRVIKMWQGKVTQAEKLCMEAGVDPALVGAAEAEAGKPKAKPKPAAKPKATASPKPKPVAKAGSRPPAEKKAGARAPAKPKVEPHLCLCGCGAMANPGRNFLQGHDARLASMIKKYDKGELKLAALPDSVQKMVRGKHEIVVRIREH